MGKAVAPFRRRVLAAVAAAPMVVGLAVMGAAPTAATASPPACEREQADPAAAKRMTEICRAPVEILAERTPYSQVFLNPDGTSTLEQSVEPQRVQQGKNWVPIDTTLRRTPDGVSPKAAVLPMTSSGGGDTLVGRLGSGGKEVALRWGSKLPKPDLKGDTAIYRDVLKDVDLRVTASATGFSEVLVVHTRQAAIDPRLKTLKFGLTSKGVEVKAAAGGGLRAQDSSGTEIFTAPAPMMWDSTEAVETGSVDEPDVAGKPDKAAKASRTTKAVMPLEVAKDVVTVTPDKKLLSDPRTKYPVYIDPSVTGSISGNAWTSVWSKHPTRSFWQNTSALTDGGTLGSAGAGRTEDCSGCSDHIIRSFFRMDTSKVKGKVSKAQFSIEQRWSWTCSPASNAKVWKTGGISSSTTWKNQPTWYSSNTAQVNGNRKYGAVHGCKGPGNLEFNVTNMVTSGASTVTLGLRAVNEGTLNQWKRFKPSTARLSVTFNQVPTALASRKSDGKPCVVGAGRPYVLWTTDVKLTGFQQDPDAPPSLTTYFYWWVKGTQLSESNRVQQSNGNKATVTGTVPNGRLTDGGTYIWRAKTSDGSAETWSGTCEFTVDKTPPPNPGAITSTSYSSTVPSGGVGVEGTFSVAVPSTRKEDVTGYAWTLNSGEQLAAKAHPKNANYSATIPVKPTKDGINTLRVWAKDRAGRFSPSPATYSFQVRAGTGPAAEWTFDEAAGTTTAADISEHGNTLTLGGSAARAAGRGNAGSALSLNGTSGFAAITGPITYPHPDTGTATAVRTDTSFTVAARVRLTSTTSVTGQRVAIAAAGSRTSAYTLGYSGPDNRWRFTMAGSDADNPALYSVLSTAAPTAGKWAHLAATYDAGTKKLTLYVNGVAQSATATLTGGFHAAGAVTVGKRKWNGADDGFLNGQVDDVRVYSFVEAAGKLGVLAEPLQPLITFPDGAEISAGGTLAVRLDAAGDTNVTRFKYSIDGAGLGSTITVAAGGAVEFDVPVGAITGERPFFAASDDMVRVGPPTQAEFTVLPGGSLSGSVLDTANNWDGYPGATVTLQPGGYTATTDADGGYVFADIPRGTYSVSAAAGGRCGMAGSQPFLVDGQGLNLELYLHRKADQLGHTCAERTMTFATGTTVLPLTGDDAVTTVTLPFAFPFYGGNYRTVWVDTNGVLSFTDPGRSFPYTGTGDLIAAAEPNAVVAPFWDDLVVDGSAAVRTAVTGSGGTEQVLIEWRNVHRKGNTAQRISFSVTLGIDGTVTANYSGLDNAAEQGDNALVGIEAPTGDDGFAYSAGEPVLANGKAIVFSRPGGAGELEVHNLTGKLTNASGAAVSGATITLDPSGLTTTTGADGTYSYFGVVADSYTVTSQQGARCGTKAEAQVELFADVTQNLQLGPDYAAMGYACAVGAGGYTPATDRLSLSGDDVETDVWLPFAMQFYGRSANTASVSTNGWAGIGGGYLTPMWSDLVVDDSASMWTQTRGTAPNRQYVIEWRDVLYLGTTDRSTFQLILHENGQVAYHYGAMSTDVQKGSTSTIGMVAMSFRVADYFSEGQPALTPSSSITYTPTAPAGVTGILTEAVTAEPIAGATITLNPSGVTSTTGADGSYQFANVAPGAYLLLASEAGNNRCLGQYATAELHKTRGDAKVDLSMSHDADAYYDCTNTQKPFVAADNTLAISGDDETAQVTAPFPIKLYGESTTKPWISTNGFLTLGPEGADDADRTQLPSGAMDGTPNAAIYPFWGDWVVDGSAAIATKATGSAPNRQWIVEWRNVSWYGNDGVRVSFEIVFDENGGIAFAYNGIDDNPIERGAEAAVGIEDPSGTVAFQYLYSADLLGNGLGVEFAPKAPESNTINGTVTCEGIPVDGATVNVAGQSTPTWSDGTYFLGEVPTKTQSLVATVPSGECAGSTVRTVLIGANPVQVDFAVTATAEGTGYTVIESEIAYQPLGADAHVGNGWNTWHDVQLPFPVQLYGQSHTTMRLGAEGSLEFANAYLYVNRSNWEADEQADIRAVVRGTAPNRQFVVEWHNVRHHGDQNTRVNFQAILDEAGGFSYVYPSTDTTFVRSGGSSTIGLQNKDGLSVLLWSDRLTALRPGVGLRFDPVPTA